MHPERIEDTLAFVRAAEARSFTIAAEQLGLSRSTIGKRITRLEARLGVRLLQRTTRNVTLTDEGAVFYEHCIEILKALEAAEAGAQDVIYVRRLIGRPVRRSAIVAEESPHFPAQRVVVNGECH